MAYRRSQEIPEDAARLKVAAVASSATTVAAISTNPPTPKLEAVPGFRPKTNAPMVATNAGGGGVKAKAQNDPEVRKAVAVEPEIRKAIPVEPRKGE
jgi:hypothetical protein